MEFMLEVEDEDNWAEAETSESNTETSLYDVGKENIDRFAKTIGAEKVMRMHAWVFMSVCLSVFLSVSP